MKILSTEQIRLLDQKTIENQYISSFKLMERVATRLFEAISNRHKLYHSSFVIFCGKGNNGGDGLALAQLLKEAGAFVKVYLLQSKKYSSDNLRNQELLEDRGIKVEKFNPEKFSFSIKPDDILIDALIGTGLREVLPSEWGEVMDWLNQVECKDRLAIDVPSGMFVDGPTPVGAPVFKVSKVYAIHAPKIAMLLPDSAKYMDDFEVVSIDLDKVAVEEFESNYQYVLANIVRPFIHKPTKYAHKGTFGRALIIGGSHGMMGAAVLASRACMRIGAGLTTAYVPSCGYSIMQTANPEVMCMVGSSDEYLVTFPIVEKYQAIGVGIGLGTAKATQVAFANFVRENTNHLMVYDADALTLLSMDKRLLEHLGKGSILTPHPKELERLIGTWETDFEKLTLCCAFAQKYQVVLVVKGAHTAVVWPCGKIHFNSTGNWGMATAGAGDVLTGILTGLLAQGYTSEQASLLGVYLHGLAGDCAVKLMYKVNLIASDLIDNLTNAYVSLINE